MKKKDIKKLFNEASYTEEYSINTDEIKSDVFKKLNKTPEQNDFRTQEGETVEPVFVTPKPRKFPAAKVITAAATAACLSVVSIGTGFFGLVKSEQSPLSVGSDLTQEETAEGVATVEGMTSAEGPLIMRLNLLDGNGFNLSASPSGVQCTFVTTRNSYILSEENGRLYFVQNAGEIGLDHKEKAVKEDITDKISKDNFYLYSYQNPSNTVEPTHYVFIGGDVATGDYGYAEVFKTSSEEDSWACYGCYSGNHPELPSLFWDSSASLNNAQWLVNGVKMLEEQHAMRDGTGSWQENKDFKDLWSTDNQYKLTFLDGNNYIAYFPNEENPTIHFDFDVSISVTSKNYLISEENGRLYFVKNAGKIDFNDKQAAEKEDITDKINSDGYYIYSYTNPDNKEYSTHYVIVGGSIEDNDYGYVELFKTSGAWHSLFNSTQSNPAYPTNDNADGTVKLRGTKWLMNAVNDLEANYGEQIIDNFQTATGKEDVDFRNVWAADGQYMLTLLDGNTYIKDLSNEENSLDSICFDTLNYLLSEENGRLYFVKNAGKIDLNNKQEAAKEDITDKISSDDYYIFSYTNPDDKEYSTHYVIVGGSIEDNDYGYVELLKFGGAWRSYFRTTKNCLAYSTDKEGVNNLVGAEWLMNAVNELETNYGEQIIDNFHHSVGETVSFKNAWAY